ncbi:uncharacterized protein K02A2.6-like [Uranotaenia lowii]|uniref:uncharacterized protein K02A2.6-like n=1 Tax=Uranotaenia lowii TaxID=190385 RepID=UPI00247AEA2C|nr:uncharacterized protein K02A2.6-like [Uranotaenia lowii]
MIADLEDTSGYLDNIIVASDILDGHISEIEWLLGRIKENHYNPKLEMIVAADASQYGIGAVLLHRFPDGSIKAVSHASRTLKSAEKYYSQGEKEGSALIFAPEDYVIASMQLEADIRSKKAGSPSCAIAAKALVKSTLSSWPIPTEPWTRLHLNYAGPLRDILATNNTTPSTTEVRECISRFGCPHSIVTGNGTQFTTELFAKMCQKYGIKHVRTPACHPQCNGQAERFVDTLERAILKMGKALLTFLETYRYTLNAFLPQNKSPTEALLGRKICIKFDLMKRSRPQPTLVNENQNKQNNQKHGSKQRLFQPNDKVFALIHIRNQQHWA